MTTDKKEKTFVLGPHNLYDNKKKTSRMSSEPTICSLENFKSFFYAKAYDVIGNGSFKKHLARCKDAGDLWAVEMGNHIQIVQQNIREITNKVTGMPQTSNKLHEICRDVMMGAQPPTKLNAGCVKCCITQRQCMKCLDLTRNHKGTQPMFVDARFCYFFMLLWYCNKIEYIIRSFTRTWLDARDENETFQYQCEQIKVEMEDTLLSMHKLFVIAKQHITSTLHHYERNHKLSVFLESDI